MECWHRTLLRAACGDVTPSRLSVPAQSRDTTSRTPTAAKMGMWECISPREQIAKLRFTKRAWVYDLGSQVKTGDIILFSSKHSASNITKFFTASGARPQPPTARNRL